MRHLFTIIFSTLLISLTYAQWQKTNFPCPDCEILEVFGHGNDVFAFTTIAGIQRSSDSGATWVSANTGLSGVFAVWEMTSNDQMLFVATNKGVFSSTNNGETWQQVAGGLDTEGYWSVATLGDLVVALGTDAYELYYSTDGGINWTAKNVYILGSSTGYLFDVEIVSEDFWLVSASNTIAYTTDGGENWTEVNSLGSSDFVAAASNTGNLFVGSTGDGLFQSMDMGQNWGHNSAGSCNGYIQDILSTGPMVYVAGACGIIKTSDNGQTWSSMNEGSMENTLVLCLEAHDGALYAGTGTNGLWRYGNFAGSGEEKEAGTVALFPTPASSQVNINISQGLSYAHITYAVYDVRGRKLLSEKSSNNSWEIDCSHWPPGMYFLKIQAGGKTATERIIVNR